MVKLKQLPDYTWEIPNPVGTWIVSPDKHGAPPEDKEGGVDPWAFSCLLQATELVKPVGKVDLGDFGEWTSVSPWKYKRRKRPDMARTIDNLNEDVEYVGHLFDDMDQACKNAGTKKKIVLQGNHEVWVDNMIDEWKDLLGDIARSDLDLGSMMKFKERGWTYMPNYGDYVRLGNLFLYHGGHFGGQYHAAAHVRDLSASVMYAHYHDYQVAKRGLLGKGLHAAWAIGSLCKPRKPFMKGKPANWSHNFALVHVEKDGTFHVEVVEIFNGKCYVQGQKVTG
jgi:hypothetical protein